MIFKNCDIFIDNKFINLEMQIQGEKIVNLAPRIDETDEIYDCNGLFISPGFVDIHTHGCVGYDFSYATEQEISKMQQFYAKNGITSILPTTVTLSYPDIKNAVKNISNAMNNNMDGAHILGVNLEGPFLSKDKCGAHDISLLREPDIDFVNSLGDIIKEVVIDPSYPTSEDFVKKFKGITSIGHTPINYETALRSINLGAAHITHIFNAMNPMLHRESGVVGAFGDSNAIAEIICDTVHVSAPVLRLVFKAFSDRLAIISDSMCALGMKNGSYTLGKLHVNVRDGKATLDDGTLAGSVTDIAEMGRRLIKIGIEIEKVISSLTYIPAKSLNCLDKCGQIKIGYSADIVIHDKDLNIKNVFVNGRQFHS